MLLETFQRLYEKDRKSTFIANTLIEMGATFLDKEAPYSKKDVYDWAKKSLKNAEGLADDFDMEPEEFEDFCNLTMERAEEVARELNKLVK
jgi:hypothetical protein